MHAGLTDWPPYPELTFQFFGEVVGHGQKHTEQDQNRTGRDLGTKAAQQAWGKGGGQEALSLPVTLPVPLAGPRHPSGHFPTRKEGGKGSKGEGAALTEEKGQGRGHPHEDLWEKEGRAL